MSSVQAGSLAEAARILENMDQKPACVIVDLDLPDGDGTELLKLRTTGANEALRTTGPVDTILAAVERLLGQAARAEQLQPSF